MQPTPGSIVPLAMFIQNAKSLFHISYKSCQQLVIALKAVASCLLVMINSMGNDSLPMNLICRIYKYIVLLRLNYHNSNHHALAKSNSQIVCRPRCTNSEGKSRFGAGAQSAPPLTSLFLPLLRTNKEISKKTE